MIVEYIKVIWSVLEYIKTVKSKYKFSHHDILATRDQLAPIYGLTSGIQPTVSKFRYDFLRITLKELFFQIDQHS